jgi:hypothetical protein
VLDLEHAADRAPRHSVKRLVRPIRCHITMKTAQHMAKAVKAVATIAAVRDSVRQDQMHQIRAATAKALYPISSWSRIGPTCDSTRWNMSSLSFENRDGTQCAWPDTRKTNSEKQANTTLAMARPGTGPFVAESLIGC